MERSTIRKVIRAGSLSLLLATATGVAGLEIASPAMAQSGPFGSNPAQEPGSAQPADPTTTTPAPTTDPNPAGGLPVPVPTGLVPALP
jgi:hypothetical protein